MGSGAIPGSCRSGFIPDVSGVKLDLQLRHHAAIAAFSAATAIGFLCLLWLSKFSRLFDHGFHRYSRKTILTCHPERSEGSSRMFVRVHDIGFFATLRMTIQGNCFIIVKSVATSAPFCTWILGLVGKIMISMLRDR